jgi:thiamine biosynthesis lipoprotein
MQKHSTTFEALGTQWSIETEHSISEQLASAIRARIEVFEKTYSRFRSDSLISAIAKNEGAYTFPEDAAKLFDFYKKLYDITDGKVTPLIGNMLERAGYDAAYSFVQKEQQKLPSWNEAIDWRPPLLSVKQKVTLDIGAAGKGYMVDIVCMLLNDAGINDYVVDASGDMRHKGNLENKVGLEDPRTEGMIIGAIDVKNKSLCASATNRRKWGNGQHHMYDPDTMKPTKDIIATWVIAESTMIADGMATALFFTDPKRLQESFAFEFLRMHENGAIDYSPAFEGKLF